MPTYDYYCDKCDIKEEYIHGISESPEYKCSECGTVMVRLFSTNSTGFIFKGGTPAIHYREKRNRMKKREETGIKQQMKHSTGERIQPNVAGYETDSWSDAQKVAKEAGMNHESYQPYVDKEKKNKIIV